MSLRQIVFDRILDLEREEEDNVTYLKNVVSRQPSYLADTHSKELIQFLFKNDRHGKVLFDRGWGNLIDKSSAISHLLYNSNLVVDLKGKLKSNQDFVDNYGLTVHQMLQLARSSKITINLLAYDSTKKKGFAPYLEFKSANEDEENAYCDLFLYENGMRIFSFRRDLFFELKLKKRGYHGEDYYLEGLELLSRIKSLPVSRQDELLRSDAFRDNLDGDIEALITSLAKQYAYNKKMSLINLVDKDLVRLNQFIDVLLLKDDNASIIKFAYLLRGLKTLIASPLTASMGGTYNMSPNSVSALIQLHKQFDNYGFDELRSIPDMNTIHAKTIGEEIKENSLNYLSKRVAKVKSIRVPKELNATQFESFLSFITEQKDSVKKISITVDNLSVNPYLTESRISLIDEYFERCNNISSDISFQRSVIGDSIGGGVSGFVTTTMTLLGIDTNKNILNAVLGGIGVTMLSKTTSANSAIAGYINKIYGNKYQMAMDMAKVLEIVNCR